MNISIWAVCKAEQISESSIVVLFGTFTKAGKNRVHDEILEQGSKYYMEIFKNVSIPEALKQVEMETINCQLILDPDDKWKLVSLKKWNKIEQQKIAVVFKSSTLEKIANYKNGKQVDVPLQYKPVYVQEEITDIRELMTVYAKKNGIYLNDMYSESSKYVRWIIELVESGRLGFQQVKEQVDNYKHAENLYNYLTY